MATGKAVNLRVRPVQSADLCYPVDGTILFQPDPLLGKTVQPYNLNGLYQGLGTAGGDKSRLVWDSSTIRSTLQPHVLSALRAESVKADLDQAIGMRQNAYLTTYSDTVVALARRIYFDDPSDQTRVLHRLVSDLEGDTFVLHGTLNDLYLADGVWGNPIKKAKTDTTFSSVLHVPTGGVEYNNTATSHSETMGYEYRLPSVENDIRYRRAMIGHRQEFLAAFRMKEMCANAGVTFPNELAAFDQQIRKLQVAYIDTMLVPPFAGVVTGVFRNTGDFVSAGQPVARVEDDKSVYLVGTIKYRGMLRVNSKVSVSTKLFDAPGGQQTNIEGVVSSVRGHDSADEQWDVLILCSNRTAVGDPIVPLNYNFDFESTTIDITAV
ncbi:HlyD family efflux transporter periplasmic adaptor subunit [Streptomyces lunaelactis]|uniref:HlyD family efflux transporter periplasmic adaptor subunit n=1 Tax=Streptomyces lunaelactis TaxID=1535768 RepID=UPI001585C4B6|nr:HlyD family secretion protein [Streptomyces lunaelactis]NUK25996.1 HlyD family secretion protein [Streptomyces lunaelactis]